MENVVKYLGDPAGWEIVHFGSHGVADKSSNDSDSCDAGNAEADKTPQVKSKQTSSTTDRVDAYIELKDDEKLKTSNLMRNFISKPRLAINHVFLSACETSTANLDDLKAGGNTHKTLCTAFLAIGAGDVIASHWKVDEASTEALFKDMASHYEQRASSTRPPSTEDVAKMLFKARNNIRQLRTDSPNRNQLHDWRTPYFWNPFTIWTTNWTPE